MFSQSRNGNIKLHVPSAITLLALMAMVAPCFSATQTSEPQHNAPQMTAGHAVSFTVSQPLRELVKLPATHHGSLYGTTLRGGSSTNCYQGCGVVFEITQ
jgi:hypothetical protein